MVIDSHQHFWNYQPLRDAWITEDMRAIRTDFTPYDLLRELKENQVDGSVAVQADQSENETSFLVDIAERHDFVKGVVGWIDLQSDTVEERLNFYHSTTSTVKGFRHIVQSETDDNFLLTDKFCRGIGLLKNYSFTYDILIYPKQLPAAIRFVERFPDQKFVLDHIAKPDIKNKKLEPWSGHIRELAAFGNLYCKISGIITEADWNRWQPEDVKPYLDVIFQAFGCNRLMFGSDWPVCLVAGSYGKVKGIITDYIQQFTEEQRQAVMADNAITFYGL